MAWADRTGGRLSADEKIALARNLASLRAEIVFDEARYRLGLLRPAKIELDILTPPDTQFVRDADEFARSACSDVLWAHCLRTYYFGAQVAAFDGIKFDRELFYAAAICHDVGVNEDVGGPVAACCFAHSGGRLTCERLANKGHGEWSVRAGDAISTHMNLVVPPDQYPSECTLVAVGATCDIFGAYVRRIEPMTLAATVERAPRTGLFEAFGPFLAKPHLDDSRTALLVQMGAFESNGTHPVESVLASQRSADANNATEQGIGSASPFRKGN
ncbi:phosphohydrolase [Mesorhizobium sp. NZP2077]|uniref:phosphohydrolase n=1 Tax=Mesorhizobium sp. NZP2077 TaxID=2483404 RepID=UPI0015561BEF|nr:phosphohydrolase [Mesorhizobium sp. NZP2077]QKD19140.1 phosphohydrolase [Mesorhizobium sp. NZP2077]